MPKMPKKPNIDSNFELVQTVAEVKEYVLKSNGLRILYMNVSGTGVVTTNITYFVGSGDEEYGKTGLAHMLEHMLFKPTKSDLKRQQDSGAMGFERETGVILNANTWNDRTTYYFSMPTELLPRALSIEADRMQNVVLTDEEFKPERNNVLSEFDMYNGDPKFALGLTTTAAARLAHPYRHPTIGFREDIEDYTSEKLETFYRQHYCPNNAILMIVGDVTEEAALELVEKHFAKIKPNPNLKPRREVREPKQEGIRRVTVERPGTINALQIAIPVAGFPSRDWFVAMVAFRYLAGSPTSYLYRKFVDTGKVTEIEYSLAPFKDPFLVELIITLPKPNTHEKLEAEILKALTEPTEAEIKKEIQAIKKKILSEEAYGRDSSLNITAELTEYASAGDWTQYFKTEEIMKTITAKAVKAYLQDSIKPNLLTIGYYKSL